MNTNGRELPAHDKKGNKMKEIIFYLKEKGYREYYKVTAHFKKSNRNYKLLIIDNAELISEREYYKQPKAMRFIQDLISLYIFEKKYYHEIGNEKWFEALESAAE